MKYKNVKISNYKNYTANSRVSDVFLLQGHRNLNIVELLPYNSSLQNWPYSLSHSFSCHYNQVGDVCCPRQCSSLSGLTQNQMILWFIYNKMGLYWPEKLSFKLTIVICADHDTVQTGQSISEIGSHWDPPGGVRLWLSTAQVDFMQKLAFYVIWHPSQILSATPLS